MTHLDIVIDPADQGLAARITAAFLDADAEQADRVLAELADAGLERSLAVNGVLARNLASTLETTTGADAARLVLERTICEAQAAGDE
jgi:hypothetical protein